MEGQSDWVLPKDQPMQECLEWYAELTWWCQGQWEWYGQPESNWAAHQHQQDVLQWAAWQHKLQEANRESEEELQGHENAEYRQQEEKDEAAEKGLRHEEVQGLRHEEPQYAAIWNVRLDLCQKDLHQELYEIDVEPDYIVKVEVLDRAFLLCYSTHPHQAKTMCLALDGMDYLPSNGRLRMEMLHNPFVPSEIMNAYHRMVAFRRATPLAAGLCNPFCLSKA